ncbi:MAG: hypothetical protein JWM68_1398 [Verrucomicrobiales bacterium]|nr:hypothetical protein [Verrucomicrobiales bacterium]
MSENVFYYKPLPALLTSAGDAATAADALKLEVPLLQNSEPKIRIDIAALLLAINIYETAKTELSARRETVRTVTESTLDRMILARDNFKPVLGSQFGQPWVALGMPDSLAFPRTAVELQPIVGSYKEYLETHPAQEVAAKEITAAAFDALFTGLNAARDAVTAQELVIDNAKGIRDDKAAILRKRMRSLVDELNMLLGPLDARWKRYGFNMPGAQETPDVPTNIQVILIGPNAAAMKWEAPARADYFRVWRRIIGVDAEPVAVGSPADLDFTLENLPAASTVEVYLSAVNNGGESALSEKVTIVTH